MSGCVAVGRRVLVSGRVAVVLRVLMSGWVAVVRRVFISGRVAVIRGLIGAIASVLVRRVVRAVLVKDTRVAVVWLIVRVGGGGDAMAMRLLVSVSVIVAMVAVLSVTVVRCSVFASKRHVHVTFVVPAWRTVVVVVVIAFSELGRLIITDDAAALRDCFQFACCCADD